MFNKMEMLSISPNLKTEFLKMASKSEIKTKFTNRVKDPNLFFYLILHKISCGGGKKHKMCTFVKLRDTEKNIRKGKWVSLLS